jgi:hypothetical protein
LFQNWFLISNKKAKKFAAKLYANLLDWVSFDVGGIAFKTTRRTLKSDPDSIFPLLLTDERKKVEEEVQKYQNKEANERRLKSLRVKLTKISHSNDEQKFMFDRDPNYFGPVLNYLRTGKLIHDQHISLIGILEEAKFFEVKGLIKLVEGN